MKRDSITESWPDLSPPARITNVEEWRKRYLGLIQQRLADITVDLAGVSAWAALVLEHGKPPHTAEDALLEVLDGVELRALPTVRSLNEALGSAMEGETCGTSDHHSA